MSWYSPQSIVILLFIIIHISAENERSRVHIWKASNALLTLYSFLLFIYLQRNPFFFLLLTSVCKPSSPWHVEGSPGTKPRPPLSHKGRTHLLNFCPPGTKKSWPLNKRLSRILIRRRDAANEDLPLTRIHHNGHVLAASVWKLTTNILSQAKERISLPFLYLFNTSVHRDFQAMISVSLTPVLLPPASPSLTSAHLHSSTHSAVGLLSASNSDSSSPSCFSWCCVRLSQWEPFGSNSRQTDSPTVPHPRQTYKQNSPVFKGFMSTPIYTSEVRLYSLLHRFVFVCPLNPWHWRGTFSYLSDRFWVLFRCR